MSEGKPGMETGGSLLSDEVLLGICRLSAADEEVTPEVLGDLRSASALIGPYDSRFNAPLPNVLTMLASVLGRLSHYNPTHLPFGYSGPSFKSAGWINQEDLDRVAKQIIGLMWEQSPPEFVANMADAAVTEAVKLCFIEEKQYDAWRPGMTSGSGWRTAVAATPYGIAKARGVANLQPSKAQSPGHSATVSVPKPSIPPPDQGVLSELQDDAGHGTATVNSSQPMTFYIYVSSQTSPELGPTSVFFKSASEEVAQSLCRLCKREFAANDPNRGFFMKPASKLPPDEQILLDEAIDGLGMYDDPDPGIYDPPVDAEVIRRAQYADRASTWEGQLRERMGDGARTGNAQHPSDEGRESSSPASVSRLSANGSQSPDTEAQMSHDSAGEGEGVTIPFPATELYGEVGIDEDKGTRFLQLFNSRPGGGRKPEACSPIPLKDQAYRILQAGIDAARENHIKGMQEKLRESGQPAKAMICEPDPEYPFEIVWDRNDLARILYNCAFSKLVRPQQKKAINTAMSRLRSLVRFEPDGQGLITEPDESGRRFATVRLRLRK